MTFAKLHIDTSDILVKVIMVTLLFLKYQKRRSEKEKKRRSNHNSQTYQTLGSSFSVAANTHVFSIKSNALIKPTAV